MDWVTWSFIGFVALVFALLCLSVKFGGDEHKRLMAQCMASGRQEFECVSMLRQNSSTVVPMPIIIPMK